MPALVVDDLRKTYPGTRRTPPVEAVRGISFQVESGEFFGLLGPNGAGKSTTLGCITTLVRPTSGRILVDGIDVSRAPAEAKRRIAVVPQSRNLDRDLTVREILTYHGRYFGLDSGERESRASRLLEELQVAEKANAKPQTLSGGQQQRVMIARALMHDPKILLLDEPTTGLDPQARARMWDEIRRLREGGTTVFLTTHYLEEADALCDRLAIIDHGRIVAEGTSAQLKQKVAGDVVTIGVNGAAANVLTLVQAMPFVREASNDENAGLVRLYVDSGETAVPHLLRRLDAAGLEPTSISLNKPSLDDVFLRQTGRSLREEAA